MTGCKGRQGHENCHPKATALLTGAYTVVLSSSDIQSFSLQDSLMETIVDVQGAALLRVPSYSTAAFVRSPPP